MARDKYQILGVSKNATTVEVRAAYLRLARICHPDLNPDNARAELEFKTIRLAYEAAICPEAGRLYDLRESDNSVVYAQDRRWTPSPDINWPKHGFDPQFDVTHSFRRRRNSRRRALVAGLCLLVLVSAVCGAYWMIASPDNTTDRNRLRSVRGELLGIAIGPSDRDDDVLVKSLVDSDNRDGDALLRSLNGLTKRDEHVLQKTLSDRTQSDDDVLLISFGGIDNRDDDVVVSNKKPQSQDVALVAEGFFFNSAIKPVAPRASTGPDVMTVSDPSAYEMPRTVNPVVDAVLDQVEGHHSWKPPQEVAMGEGSADLTVPWHSEMRIGDLTVAASSVAALDSLHTQGFAKVTDEYITAQLSGFVWPQINSTTEGVSGNPVSSVTENAYSPSPRLPDGTHPWEPGRWNAGVAPGHLSSEMMTSHQSRSIQPGDFAPVTDIAGMDNPATGDAANDQLATPSWRSTSITFETPTVPARPTSPYQNDSYRQPLPQPFRPQTPPKYRWESVTSSFPTAAPSYAAPSHPVPRYPIANTYAPTGYPPPAIVSTPILPSMNNGVASPMPDFNR